MKTIAKIITTFIVGTLFFTACGKDEDTSAFKEKRLKTIEVKYANSDSTQATFNYFYDADNRIAKISLKNQKQVDTYRIEFSYNTANNVENIRYVSNNEFTDYTFTYDANSKVPTKLTYSGSVPTYTADITNNNGSLFWKGNKGDNYILENANFDNNTFESISFGEASYKFKENNQLKNGLTQKQDIIKLPLLMSCSDFLFLNIILFSLQISSKPIENTETSEGHVFNYEFEKDKAGYITKSKSTLENNALTTLFHYQ